MDTVIIILNYIAKVLLPVSLLMAALNWGRMIHTEVPASLDLRHTAASKAIWGYILWSLTILASLGVQIAVALVT